MAIILCAYSGIEFKVDHFPAYLDSRECYHPVFTLSSKKLLSYTNKWASGNLTDIDSYLLYLALFSSTELIEFRTAAKRTDKTKSTVAQNMSSLIRIISYIDTIKHPAFVLPKFVISSETSDLSNSKYWLETWIEAYNKFSSGYRSVTKDTRILRREAGIEKLLRNSTKKVESYAGILSDWAADAAEFPAHCSDYWKSIIKKCVNFESIFTIETEDIEELIEYCEDNIDHGSLSAHALMSILRNGLKKNKSFNISNFSNTLGKRIYTILSDSADLANKEILEQTKEAEFKTKMISEAPATEPKESDYPSTPVGKINFNRAKYKYRLAIAHLNNKEEI